MYVCSALEPIVPLGMVESIRTIEPADLNHLEQIDAHSVALRAASTVALN